MNNNQHISKLRNAPLQEVVLEVRWKPDIDEQTGRATDSEFELAQGRLAERLEEKFSFHRRVVPAPVVPLLTGQVVHQFWRAEGCFPIVQFGPCIATINEDGEGYEWKDEFKPLIRETLERLISSYRKGLRLSEVKLFYIDAIDIPEGSSVPEMLEKLKFGVRFDIEVGGALEGAGVDLRYRLEHGSVLQLSVQHATNNKTGNPALLWHTAVYRVDCESWGGGEQVVEKVMDWCEYAHSVTSPLFRKMVDGDLYASFV